MVVFNLQCMISYQCSTLILDLDITIDELSLVFRTIIIPNNTKKIDRASFVMSHENGSQNINNLIINLSHICTLVRYVVLELRSQCRNQWERPNFEPLSSLTLGPSGMQFQIETNSVTVQTILLHQYYNSDIRKYTCHCSRFQNVCS